MNVGSFSTGISWEYYDESNIDQSNNTLYVTAKYKNIKEEILHYQHLSIEQYEQEIVPKANAFHQTILVKSMTCDPDWSNDFRRYGVSANEILSKDRLISMILYTDYTNLSSSFSSTFRRTTVFEPVEATKQKHRHYYWMSKLLRETVVVYGQGNVYDYNGTLGGPFFCGMSMVLTLPQFVIHLYSPTSTSCHIEVAIKFSGQEGIIVEFMPNDVKGLDLSWLSRYKEEDERYTYITYSK